MAAAMEEVDAGPQGVEKPGLMTRLRTNGDASLKTVRIRGGQDADDMRRLAEALVTNKVCTHIFLDYNCCGSKGAQELAAALRYNKTLRHIGLRGNEVGDDGALALVAALSTDASLISLDLRGNDISSLGMGALAQALRRNRTLTSLDLRGNRTTDAATTAINRVLDANRAAHRRREMAAAFSAKLCAFDMVAVVPAAAPAVPGATSSPPFWLGACLGHAASPYDGGVGYKATKRGARWRKGADVRSARHLLLKLPISPHPSPPPAPPFRCPRSSTCGVTRSQTTMVCSERCSCTARSPSARATSYRCACHAARGPDFASPMRCTAAFRTR